MFGSNSYLGLTNHPKVKESAKKAIDQYGTSCSGSRFLNGTSKLHIELEEKIARFVRKEAALVFTTGFQTNLGILSALTGRTGILILDELNHASIIEGSRLSFSRVLKFRHNDMDDLAKIVSGLPYDQVKMIVVDGIFSMEGDICNLPEITMLSQKYNSMVMVDDAHAFGVLGDHGRGTADYFNLNREVDIIMSTFSKSLASVGGFAASTKEIINYIKHTSRPMIFSASIPPSGAAAALAALEIMESEPERLQNLWANTEYLSSHLKQLGFTLAHTESPIIPIYIRDNDLTFKFNQRLFEKGIFANPVVSPAVKNDSALIRMSVMATHTKYQLDTVIEKLREVARELNVFELIQSNS
jgi:8-amino-7-oxononanoate synthase